MPVFMLTPSFWSLFFIHSSRHKHKLPGSIESMPGAGWIIHNFCGYPALRLQVIFDWSGGRLLLLFADRAQILLENGRFLSTNRFLKLKVAGLQHAPHTAERFNKFLTRRRTNCRD